MPFRFPLSTVLRYRLSVERREEIALGKILVEIARTRQQIEKLTADIALRQRARNESLSKPIPAYDLQFAASEINAAIDRRKMLIESLAPLDVQRRTQMKVYQAAHRDRQMLSEMATRQRDAYEQERARAEQKFTDDIFAARAQRS
jgi:flagellar export protein FliJ